MILHLSDPHFGTEQAEIAQALRQLCWQLKPELVVVSGDLTQRARKKQFAAARDYLDSLLCPYLVVPGNHDIPLFHVAKRVLRPFHRFEQYFGATESMRETAHFVVIGVNTIVPKHHTKGRISKAQIQQVARLLAESNPDKYKIVVSHQPFMVPPQGDKAAKDIPSMMLPALHRWSEQGMDALLHGHLHHAAVYDLNQYFLLQQPHPVLDIHAGTALSQRTRHAAPNAVNVITADMRVIRYDYQARQQQFVSACVLWSK